MWQIIVIIICLGINALIAATEFAFIAIGKPRLKKLAAEGHESAKRVLTLRENPERTLSILQLGITFIGVVAAAVGGVQIGGWLHNWLTQSVGLGKRLSEVLAILLFVVPYTYINVVLSELLPKSLALRNPKWIIFHVDRWLIFLEKILAPIVFILEKSTKLSVKLFFSWVKHEEPNGDEIIAVSKLIRPYMLNLAKIEKRKIRDAMIPWSEVDKISTETSIEEVKKFILRTGHTRIPIVKNGDPAGLLLSKEFTAFYEKNDPNWQVLERPIIKLNDQDTLLHGLRLMQSQRSHLSLVLSATKPIGIVTIEDILEEVVGEIYDEDDINSFIGYNASHKP
ncbi:MAG: Magnesium and cobalt efflux protein CorC [Chlamydiae bacterium]|nr:Magnesium and cobalt efflux protein CorC [Chlamydiota bacterium]